MPPAQIRGQLPDWHPKRLAALMIVIWVADPRWPCLPPLSPVGACPGRLDDNC